MTIEKIEIEVNHETKGNYLVEMTLDDLLKATEHGIDGLWLYISGFMKCELGYQEIFEETDKETSKE